MTRTALALGCLLLLSGCGVQAPDLFVLYRTGSEPDANAIFVVRDDAHVRCSPRGRERDLPDPLLLDARDLEHQIEKDAKTSRRYAPRPGSQLSYAVRIPEGTVRWSDTSRPLPERYFKLAYLARQIARGPCGLTR